MATVKEAQIWGENFLKKNNFETATIEVNAILSDFLKVSPTHITLKASEKIKDPLLDQYRSAIIRRSKNEPVAYILGKKNFLGIDLKIDSRVLVPRPETEILVEKIISYLKTKKISNPKILDICSGSGCISIGLAKNVTDVEITAIDISAGAIQLARENAELNGLKDRISFIQSDLYSSLGPGLKGYFDIIVSNPPYILTGEMPHLEADLSFEPRIALDGGKNGLNVIRPLIENAEFVLRKKGSLWIEIGKGQAQAIQKIMKECKFKNIENIPDLNGIDRIIRGINGSV